MKGETDSSGDGKKLAAYPRLAPQVGSADQLEALGNSYFALSRLLVLGLVFLYFQIIGFSFFSDVVRTDGPGAVVLDLLLGLVLGSILTALSYRPCQWLAFGRTGSTKPASAYVFLIAFFSIFGLGWLPLMILAALAWLRILNFGISTAFLWNIRTRDVREKVQMIRAAEGQAKQLEQLSKLGSGPGPSEPSSDV